MWTISNFVLIRPTSSTVNNCRVHYVTTYRLQNDSILNSKFFHVVDGLVPDVMHDILEGSLQYEVKELLKHFIHTEKYFTLDQLNNKINEFPYVLTDKAARPAMIGSTVLASADHSVNGLFILCVHAYDTF